MHVHYFHHYMFVSRSVTPCPAHVFLSSFFVSVYQYTCLSVTFIRTISSLYVCVSVFLRPYVRISCSQLCVRVSVCHIHVYYTSLSYISTTVCRSTCLCVCLFSCKYITCTVVCLSVCYIRAPSVEAFVGEPGQEVVLWRHPMTSYEKLTYTRNCNLGLWVRVIAKTSYNDTSVPSYRVTS